MYDPHREVARIATEAFEGVFTEEKRDKTLLFCRDDVLGLLRSNLLEVSVFEGTLIFHTLFPVDVCKERCSLPTTSAFVAGGCGYTEERKHG